MPGLISPETPYTPPQPTDEDYSTGVLNNAVSDAYEGVGTTATDIGAAYDNIPDPATPGADFTGTATPSDTSNFTGYEAPTNLGAIKAGSEYTTPESMVSNQLTSLLASGSPYMTQVENKSREDANKLGLLSSSMAVGAGQRAAISSAMPIAMQDAATHAGLQATQQGAEYQRGAQETAAELAGAADTQAAKLNQEQLDLQNSFQANMAQAQSDEERSRITNEYKYNAAMTKADAETKQVSQDAAMAFESAMAEANSQTQAALASVQAKWDEGAKIRYADMINEFELQRQNNDISQERYNAAIASSNQIMQNTQSVIMELLKDPDIMASDPSGATQQAMLNTILDQSMASMEVISGMSGVDAANYDALMAEYAAAMTFGNVPTS